jgi:hypothetical protein
MERFVSLPVLSPALTAGEFSACREKSECCNCGSCCIVYDVHVPNEHGNPDSPMVLKPEGQPCVQLISDARGRLYCALQQYKHDPRYARKLRTCTNWKGNDGEGTYRQFDHLWQVFSATVRKPMDAEHVYDMETLVLSGRVPQTALQLVQRKLLETPEALTDTLQNIGRLCSLSVPFGLLDTLNIAEIVEKAHRHFQEHTRFKFGVWSMKHSEYSGTKEIYARYFPSHISL